MIEISNSKIYDLEERTYAFARDVALFCKKFTRSTINIEYIKQVIRSSGSIGANYIEANESLSKKDFLMRVRISRKESKETIYWLKLLIDTNEGQFNIDGDRLIQEALELKKILSSIIERSK